MEHIRETLKKIPKSPGVYIYKDNAGTIIYVGKAIDLWRRVSQYFSRDDAVGAKTKLLVSQIESIETIRTPSEFDALILEAALIRKYLPKYNVIARDDKSSLYIVITMGEELPRILFQRKSDLDHRSGNVKHDKVFGPFQSSRTARILLRNLRRIVPYCLQKERNGRPCFYTHLNLCYPCPSVIAKMKPNQDRKLKVRIYRLQMKQLVNILSGKSRTVLNVLEKEMEAYAKENNFEAAHTVKMQLQSLRDLLSKRFDAQSYLSNANLAIDVQATQLDSLRTILEPHFLNLNALARIECIDIANISGTDATASLVVLEDGIISPGQYRRFRIRRANIPNDVAMIAEVVNRRFTHAEWKTPDLFVVDGGKPQAASALTTLTIMQKRIPIVGLAKRLEEIVIPSYSSSGIIKFTVVRLPLTSPAIHVLQRIRDEAHRFARSYHYLLRSKRLRSELQNE